MLRSESQCLVIAVECDYDCRAKVLDVPTVRRARAGDSLTAEHRIGIPASTGVSLVQELCGCEPAPERPGTRSSSRLPVRSIIVIAVERSRSVRSRKIGETVPW